MDRDSQISYLRELASNIRTIADSKKNRESIKRWHDLNNKVKPDRPPIWIRPVTAWRELLPESVCKCADEDLMPIEINLLRQQIKNELGDDTPFNPWYGVPATFDITEGFSHKKDDGGQPVGAWDYDRGFDYSELDKLKLPVYTYNEKKTGENLEFINSIIGDYLPAKLECYIPGGLLSLSDGASRFRGMLGLMTDIKDYPDELHKLMAYLRDYTLTAIDAYEKTGLVTPNIYEPMFCSGEFGVKTGGAHTFKNCYCSASSQEYDLISPKDWDEFLLAYQKPVFERFGRISYGCCENLTNKIDGVLSIPNLHIFVCSAWTDLQSVVDKVGDRHVIMWRQKASDVFFIEDFGKLRKGISEGLKILDGCYPQIVLREIETLGPYKNRLYDYVKMLIEEAAKF
jgi:hypothetical protein